MFPKNIMHLYKCKIIIALLYNNVKRFKKKIVKGPGMNLKTEKKVAKNIRSLREKRNMTQEMLAARMQLSGCDITRSAVAKIEVGQRHLYPDEIILIKNILKVSYEEIFDLSD